MRDSAGLKYFLTDHLGSVVAVTNASGTLISQQRYLPFGGERTNIGNITQTDFGYTGQRDLDPGMGGLMDYRARMYLPALGRFLQPDTIIPSPANPQAYNRYSYVLNNPIRFNDPTGHMCREDGKGCDGSMGGGVRIGDKIIRESEKVGGSKGNSGHSGGGGGGDNPCGSKPPYNPKYVCGITITEPSYITAIEPRVVEMVVDDDYTEFSWMGRNPSLNGQSITPIVTRKGQAVGWAQVIMDGMIYAHYNTDMLGRVTGSYVTGLIPSITSIKTGASLVGGIGVYNQTGSEVIVNNVIINNQNQSFNAPTIPNGSIGIIDAPVLRVSGDILVEVRYSVFNWNKNGDASIYAAGTISYNGHIGP